MITVARSAAAGSRRLHPVARRWCGSGTGLVLRAQLRPRREARHGNAPQSDGAGAIRADAPERQDWEACGLGVVIGGVRRQAGARHDRDPARIATHHQGQPRPVWMVQRLDGRVEAHVCDHTAHGVVVVITTTGVRGTVPTEFRPPVCRVPRRSPWVVRGTRWSTSCRSAVSRPCRPCASHSH